MNKITEACTVVVLASVMRHLYVRRMADLYMLLKQKIQISDCCIFQCRHQLSEALHGKGMVPVFLLIDEVQLVSQPLFCHG
ncbi:hypothetical protein HAPAU_38180 [Halalkalicoccus paucihalophilus]|uniref:Uncharacterized protein n=1 Tax=Halalkalicoccus paucihalophilus TaxID=1008153 RepID=A0A151A9A2_9EURY|nr:hypothetical protein HAPAU_38180 [Halalkalicoccus paucihalophilus]